MKKRGLGIEVTNPPASASLLAAGGGASLAALAFGGRVERTSASIITLAPYNDIYVAVGRGTEWLDISAGITCDVADKLINADGTEAAGAMAASTFYYLYVSSLTASYAPGDLRGSATAPTKWNGTYHLATSGNGAKWRFVGWVRTIAGPAFADSVTQRLVINYYNRLNLPMEVCPGYVNDNVQNTYAFPAGNYGLIHAAGLLEFISNGEDDYDFTFHMTGFSDVGVARIGIGDNSNTQPYFASHMGFIGSNVNVTHRLKKSAAVGYRQASMLAQSDAGNTITVMADDTRQGAAADPRVTYMVGNVRG